ncbi:MAG: formate dehydrogenase subunit alpha [Myxococcota bacterium]|nr:formate dehydrogenase subunit alpha [Myxococcota bacterium]MDW8361259.1 formate dehydrogenase subunit alpha [Myxococcales bacterium]
MSPTNGKTPTFDIELDGKTVRARPGESLLEVARRAGVYVPTLCWQPNLSAVGSCRVCLVGVKGARGPVAACTTPAQPGLVVRTDDPVARRVARTVVELVLSEVRPPERAAAAGDANCNPDYNADELDAVARHFGLHGSRFDGPRRAARRDERHPYLALDLERCILCGRCVRACDEVQGTFALTYAGRGWNEVIAAGPGVGFEASACVSCGACAASCPTGAIEDRGLGKGAPVDRVVRTTCAYCGVGCGFDAVVRDGAVVAMHPAPDGPSNLGHACLKGRFAFRYAFSEARLRAPLLRRADGTLGEASWEQALSFVAERLIEIRARYGPGAIGFVSSSRCTNEENYLVMKIARAVVGTNHVDNCSRVCHSPTSLGFIRSFGRSGSTGSFSDIDEAAVLFVTGANPTEGHPVLGARIKQAVLRGARLVVADPRRIELVRLADVFLQLRPGTNVALYNALAHVLVRDGLVDRAFLTARVDGFESLAAHLESWTPQRAAAITGVPAADIERAAHLYGGHRPALIAYGLGVTEQAQGVDGVRCLANLALLTGNVGRRGGGVHPLRGQNNVQGSSDVGALPTYLTMYRPLADPATRAPFEARWGVKLPEEPGMTLPKMLEAARDGRLRALYVQGYDIAQSEPEVDKVEQALRALELLVVHDLFECRTAQFAHVVLPGASFLEKTGTFTNAERRIQLVRRVVEPPGAVREEIDVLLELAARLGRPLPHRDAADIMDEIAALTPELRGVSHARLGTQGLQWPVFDAEHPGTPILYEERFDTPSGRAALHCAQWTPSRQQTSERYPFLLVTGRQLAHYNAGTQTRRTPNLALQGTDMLELHPDDGARLGIADGARCEVESEQGRVQVWARWSRRVAPGQLFLAFHFPELRTNVLTGPGRDPLTGCPEFKVTAVAIRPLPGPHPAPPHIARGFIQDAAD